VKFPFLEGFSLLFLISFKQYCFFREADITKERIEKMLKAGANVILTTKGIDDMALKVCIFLFHAYRLKVVAYCVLANSTAFS